MIAFEVEFLTGRCVATDRENRLQSEWPPHPARFYAALAAAHFERKEREDAETDAEQAERKALEWLSSQQVTLAAPERNERTTVLTFVPVNDSDMTKGKRSVFPRIGEGWDFRRNRQARAFPTVIPDPPVMHFLWSGKESAEAHQHRDALKRLAANVTYLGHSSSLVRVAVCDDPPEPTLRAVERDESFEETLPLRIPGPNQLAQLRSGYELSRQRNFRIELPEPPFQHYVSVDQLRRRPPPATLFDEKLIVFEKVCGRRLPLHAALTLTSTVRNALMKLADDPPPEILSGHRAGGERSTQPHLAIVPLAFVDHEYADGDIKGFALVLPRSLRDQERREDRLAMLRAAARLRMLAIGRAGVWKVAEVSPEEARLRALDPFLWTRASRTWATVTPVIFGRFPKSRGGKGRGWMQSEDVERMIREHCEMIELRDADGQPVVPKQIDVSDISPFIGVAPSSHFPSLSTDGKPVTPEFGRRNGRGKPNVRLRAHVRLWFAEKVQGPLLLGAGRYLGMGFCKPWSERRRR